MSTPIILLINGPNLNMLGVRDPHHYGTTSLAELTAHLGTLASELEVELRHFQSNHEGAIVDTIHAAREYAAFIVINAGAYTHTSIAIRDALEAVSIPFIEVHISNIYRRETFRHHSYLSALALGVIAGLGIEGYEYALRKASSLLKASPPRPTSPMNSVLEAGI